MTAVHNNKQDPTRRTYQPFPTEYNGLWVTPTRPVRSRLLQAESNHHQVNPTRRDSKKHKPISWQISTERGRSEYKKELLLLSTTYSIPGMFSPNSNSIKSIDHPSIIQPAVPNRKIRKAKEVNDKKRGRGGKGSS